MLKTDLTFFAPSDFVYYHVCVELLYESLDSKINQYAGQPGKTDIIRDAVCVTAIIKKIASTITNSGGNAVTEFNKGLISIFNKFNSPYSKVKNVDINLIISIASESKCLSFLQNKNALTLLGMEKHFISCTSTLSMSYPLFVIASEHPLHQYYSFFENGLNSGDIPSFVSSIEKSINDEKTNKPRLKRT